jgi:hypothetical protein
MNTTPSAGHSGSDTPARWDRRRVLRIIEDAERTPRTCPCGEMLVVQASDDILWLGCPAYRERPTGRLAWLRSALRDVSHDRSVLATGIGRAA